MKTFYPVIFIMFGLGKSQVLIPHNTCSASDEILLTESEKRLQKVLEPIIQRKSEDSQNNCKDEMETFKQEMREENEKLRKELERMTNTIELVNGSQNNQRDEIKTLKREVQEDDGNLKREWARLENIITFANDHKDCLWYKIINGSAASGVYDLKVGDREFSAYCDMETDGGGWTAIVSRYINSSVDFQRTWDEYKRGFGNISETYWIGNDIFHELTKGRPSEMYFIMHYNLAPIVWWQKYKHVTVQSEEFNYRLNFDVNSFEGNTANRLVSGDLSVNNGSFVTYDRHSHCSNEYGGGWWYKYSRWCGSAMTEATYGGFWGWADFAIAPGKQNLMMVRYEYK